MASIKLYYDTRSRSKDGTSPVKLLVTQKGSGLYIALNVRLTPAEWDAFNAELAAGPKMRLSGKGRFIHDQRLRAETFLLDLRRTEDVDGMGTKELRDRISAHLSGAEYRPSGGRFVPHYERFVSRRNAKGTKDLYNQTLSKMRKFEPVLDGFRFEDITTAWLNDFDTFLKETTSSNIRNRHFRQIKAVFNDAIAERATTWNPFVGFKMPKLEATRHRDMTVEQLRQLRDYPCMPWQKEYVDMFMLSFYLIGINIVDLLTARKEDVHDGRLDYVRSKTGRPYSIKIEPEAQAIIDRYPGKDWLLSPMDRYADHKNYLQHMNNALKKVGLHYVTSREKVGEALFPGISSYWARHAWGTIAFDAGDSLDGVGLSLGHSWVTKSITAVYVNFGHKRVDRLNRRVLDLLKG